MSEINQTEQTTDSWKAKTIAIGTLAGAILGAGVALLLIQRAEREDGRVSMTTGDGLKLGITVIGLLRQIVNLGEGE